MTDFQYDFLSLIRLGLGRYTLGITENPNWIRVHEIAAKQGLLAIVVDGIDKLPTEKRPPQELLLEWIGDVLQSYEYRYNAYKHSIAELAGFYNSHNFKVMILKGYACSLNWPRPEHRPCGDIDIWQFGLQKDADAMLTKEKKIKVDNSHHHHSVFNWGDFTVENHYDFVNIHHHKSNAKLEMIFKELGQDESHFDVLKDTQNGSEIKVYLPSPNLHALFLLKHAMNDFTTSSVTLRQVLDWGFHVQRYEKEIDWEWLKDMITKYQMIDFYNCINAICVEDLGFEASMFHGVQFNPTMKEKALNDILNPKFERSEPKWLIPRLFYKYRRWKANEWKRNICYSESRWSSLRSGIRNHLLKPATI